MTTTLLRTGPLSAQFGTTNRPTWGSRNKHPVAKFVDAVDGELFFTLNMPEAFAEEDISVVIQWVADTAVVGNVLWGAAFDRNGVGVTDIDADSFATEKTVAGTTAGTAGIVNRTTIAFAIGEYDGIAKGDQFRLRIRRLGTDVGDTMTDTAQLLTITITQVSTPVGGGGGGGGFFTDGTGTRAGIGKGLPAPLASGTEALAHGSGAQAYGNRSIAFGEVAAANYDNSVAFGYDAKARFVDCIAIGRDTSAGDGGYTLGRSVSIGARSRAREEQTVAIGYYAHASSVNNSNREFNVAIGARTRCNGGPQSISIGYNARGLHSSGAIVIGGSAYSNGGFSTVIGALSQDRRGGNSYGWLMGRDSRIYAGAGQWHFAMGQGNRFDFIGGEQVVITTHANRLLTGYFGVDSGVYIGGKDAGVGSANTGFGFENIVLRAGDLNRTGIYHRSGNSNGNIVLAGDAAFLGAGNGATEQDMNYNIFIATRSSYMFGYARYMVAMGCALDIGANGGYSFNSDNVVIGTRINAHDVATPGIAGGKYNVTLGGSSYSTRYGYAFGHVAVGGNCLIYGEGNTNYNSQGQVAIGYSAYIRGRGHGNVSIGLRTVVANRTSVAPGNYRARGNVSLGAYCYARDYVNAINSYVISTFAQGLNSRAWIHGHRAFGAGGIEDLYGNTKPNQSSFVIEKEVTVAAGATTVVSYPTQSDKAYKVWGSVTARRTDADGQNAVFSLAPQLVYRNAVGAPTLVGGGVWTMDQNQGAPAWTVTTLISGNNILTQVDQVAAAPVSVQWIIELHVLEIRG